MLDGLKHALTVKPFLVMLGVAFIVMSAFNGVTTWVGADHQAARLQLDRRRHHGRADAARRHHRGGRAVGALRPPGQAHPLHGHRPCGDRARGCWASPSCRPRGCSTSSPPSSASSWSPCCRSACSTPPRSPTPRRKAPPRAHPALRAGLCGLRLRHGGAAHANGSFTVSLLLSAVLLVGCAFAVSRLKDAAPAAARAGAATTVAGRPGEELAAAVPAPPAGD